MKRIAAFAIFLFVMMGILLALSPSTVSVSAGDPTLDAAIGIIIQATRQEQDRRNAISATRAAVESEAAQQRAYAQATQAAISIQQTQIASEATRQAVATRQAIESQATRQALDLQATIERREQEATATQAAIFAEATRQVTYATATSAAISAEATRQAIERQAQAENVREILRIAGIILLFIIGAILFPVSIRALWRVGQIKPIAMAESEQQSGPPPTDDELPVSPLTQVVFDQNAAQRITDILEFQDQG